MTPRIPFVVKDFSAGSLGKRCGIQIGDSLVSVNGILTPSSTDLTKALSSCAGDSIVLGYYRDNRYQESHILLGSDGKLGIYAVSDMSRFFTVNHIDYTLLQAIPAGISYGWETLVTYVSSLKILFTKDGAKNLGGFITIATLFPDHWDWLAFWNLTALLAVVLAFMNHRGGTDAKILLTATVIIALGFFTGVAFYYIAPSQGYAGTVVGLGMVAFVSTLFVLVLNRQITYVRERKYLDTYKELAYRDMLTGLGNRAAFDKLWNELSDKYEEGTEVTLFMFDLNFLKHVNDVIDPPVSEGALIQRVFIDATGVNALHFLLEL